MPTLNPSTEKRWHWPLTLLAITLFALILCWYHVSTAIVDGPIRGDAIQYYAYAWNLLHHGIFSKDIPVAASVIPDSYRDPGYPLFLALWMKLSGTATDSS